MLKNRICLLMLVLVFMIPVNLIAGISIINGLTHEKVVEQGEIYNGLLDIQNNGMEPIEIKIYQTDYLFFFDGRNLYDEPGSIARSNAN